MHFAASDEVRSSYSLSNNKNLEEAIDLAASYSFSNYDIRVLEPADFDKEKAIRYLEDFAQLSTESKLVPLGALIELFIIFKCEANKIYNMYVGKNTLNLFRNEHGQRENKYIKIWGENGEEDNYFLEKYFEELQDNAVDVDDLNGYLIEQYNIVMSNKQNEKL